MSDQLGVGVEPCGVALYSDEPCVRQLGHEASHVAEGGMSWDDSEDERIGALLAYMASWPWHGEPEAKNKTRRGLAVALLATADAVDPLRIAVNKLGYMHTISEDVTGYDLWRELADLAGELDV